LHRDPGADRAPGRFVLHELGPKSALLEGGRKRQARDAAADNQNPIPFGRHARQCR
jgi:hypothetical protein